MIKRGRKMCHVIWGLHTYMPPKNFTTLRGFDLRVANAHLVGSVLDLPRNPLHRVVAIGAGDLDDKLVVAPRSADVHIHLQSIVRADGPEEVWPCLRTVIPPVHVVPRNGRSRLVLHASFEAGGTVCQG